MDQRGDQHVYTNYVLLPVVALVLQLHIAWAGLSFFCSGRWLMVLRHDD